MAGRLAASGLHHNTVAKIDRLFRSIITTAVDDGLIARNPVRIKGASAERMTERPLRRWDDTTSINKRPGMRLASLPREMQISSGGE